MSKSKIGTIKNYFIAYLSPVVWAGFIYLLSSQESLPSLSISFYDFVFKKSAHMFVYAVLYVLLFRAYRITSHQKINNKSYLFPILVSLVYALTDELHQSFVPNRHPSIRDTGYDMLGVATVLLYQLKLI